jgi:hypothetical protein
VEEGMTYVMIQRTEREREREKERAGIAEED